jgi:hypothetical protein
MTNKLYVEAPAVDPSIGGLLPLANVITTDADRAAYLGVTHLDVLSGHSRFAPTDGSDKVFDQTEYIDGVEFVVYRGIESSLLVSADPESIAKAAFTAGESYAVESAVQSKILNLEAVDITPVPGTPVKDLRAALGLLEQFIASNYTGRPLIHGNKFAVALIHEAKVSDSFDLHTIQGTPIANGAGYGPVGVPKLTAPVLALGTTATTGGTFAAGDYSWVVTAINAAGESLASNSVTKTLALNGTQVLNWGAAPAGATGIKVWRTDSLGVTKLVATLGAVATYTDTGTAGTPGTPPKVNTTGTAPAGQAWLYVSGQVNLWQGKLQVLEGPAPADNRDFALAERPYAATVSGPVAAVLVGI